MFEAGAARKTLIGMVHLDPLPGTPFHSAESLSQTIGRAVGSALALDQAGADGCLIQTVERTYSVRDEADPARIAAMALVVSEVARATSSDFKVGVQVMYNAIRASLAVAKVAGGDFVRANALVGASLSAHGLVQADPDGVARYRASIGAADIAIVADVESMHFRWFGGGRTAGDVARMARNAGAGAVALSNPEEPALVAASRSVRDSAAGMPIILAGGTNHENAARLLAHADGAFIGGCLERHGWGGAIDPDLARDYVARVRESEAGAE